MGRWTFPDGPPAVYISKFESTFDTVHRSEPLEEVLRSVLRISLLVLFSCALTLAPSALEGQVAPAPQQTAPVDFDRIISVNPLLLIFLGYVSLDYEQRVGDAITMGASMSNFSLSDASYLSFDAKGRYYIGGRALDGLSIGALVGYTRLKEDETGFSSGALGLGFNVEHQWLLGVDERLAITGGVGGTRLFSGEDRDAFRTVIPVVRLSIGWAF